MEQVIIKINHFIVIMMVILFTPQLHSQDLPCKEKFKNGQCYKRYQEDQDGNIHGKLIVYDENGLVLITANYNHGVLHGLKKGKNIFGEWIYEWYHNDEMICSSNQPISSLEDARKLAASQKVQEKDDDWKGANQDSVKMINMNGEIFYKTISLEEKIDALESYIKKYPSDHRIEIAKKKIEQHQKILFEGITTKEECLSFKKKYPTSKHIQIINAKYNSLTLNEESILKRRKNLEIKLFSENALLEDLKDYEKILESSNEYELLFAIQSDLKELNKLQSFLSNESKISIFISYSKYTQQIIKNNLSKTCPSLAKAKLPESASNLEIHKVNGQIKVIRYEVLYQKYDIVIFNNVIGIQRPPKGLWTIFNQNETFDVDPEAIYVDFETKDENKKILLGIADVGTYSNTYCFDAKSINKLLSINLSKSNKELVYRSLIDLMENDSIFYFSTCGSKSTSNLTILKLTYLGYLYWMVGDEVNSSEAFNEANKLSLNSQMRRYSKVDDSWTDCTYKQYLQKYFHPHYIKGKTLGGEEALNPVDILNEEKLLVIFKSL